MKSPNFLKEILAYNNQQESMDRSICHALLDLINAELNDAEAKIWHRHPVWFIDGNPIVGYSKQKRGIRLMFWSGADFEEDELSVRGEKFKDASVFFNSLDEINPDFIQRCLLKSKSIQWDYKNLIKRKGLLVKIEQDDRES